MRETWSESNLLDHDQMQVTRTSTPTSDPDFKGDAMEASGHVLLEDELKPSQTMTAATSHVPSNSDATSTNGGSGHHPVNGACVGTRWLSAGACGLRESI